MRVAMVASALLACMAVSSTALADGSSGAVEVGLRTGYAIPLGAAVGGGQNGSANLDKAISGAVPIWIDAGYRLNPNLYIGAYFQYGIGFVASNAAFFSSGGTTATCGQNGLSCSTNDLKFGIDAHYHLMPGNTIDPYGGIGIGYEILNFSFSDGGQNGSQSFNGFEFLNLQVGADYKVMPDLGVGPFVMLSFDQYSNCGYGGALATAAGGSSCSIAQKAVHEWFTIGVRGAYDIHL
jgi:outer membrane protein W